MFIFLYLILIIKIKFCLCLLSLIFRIQSSSCEFSPFNNLLLDFLDWLYNQLFISLNWNDFDYFCVIENIRHWFSFEYRYLHKKVHAPICLGYEFFKSFWQKYFFLEINNCNYQAQKRLLQKTIKIWLISNITLVFTSTANIPIVGEVNMHSITVLMLPNFMDTNHS